MHERVAQAIRGWGNRIGEFRIHYQENNEDIIKLLTREEMEDTNDMSGVFKY
jgi:hypothetical protein